MRFSFEYYILKKSPTHDLSTKKFPQKWFFLGKRCELNSERIIRLATKIGGKYKKKSREIWQNRTCNSTINLLIKNVGPYILSYVNTPLSSTSAETIFVSVHVVIKTSMSSTFIKAIFKKFNFRRRYISWRWHHNRIWLQIFLTPSTQDSKISIWFFGSKLGTWKTRLLQPGS